MPLAAAVPISSQDKRIENLEKLLAIEIGRAAELLKENAKLKAELEQAKKQRDYWHRLYRKIKPNEKVTCDRNKAMIEYGEIDMSEVVGSK